MGLLMTWDTALTWQAAAAASFAGASFGFLVFGMPLALLSRLTTPLRVSRYTRQTVGACLLLGWVYFMPVTVTAAVQGDPAWPGLLWRFAYWALFCGSLWAGMAARVRVDAWVSSRRHQ